MNLFKRFSLVMILAWQLPCLAEGMSEGQIKSAYVLNFANFVEWPDGTVWENGKANLCVVGNNVLGGELFALEGRKAGGRELHVLQRTGAEENWAACHLVFIGESARRSASAIIRTLENSPILTISDMTDFAEMGGSIGLLYRKNKIAFEVNLASTKKSNLHLPGKLLNLAANVLGK